MRLSFFLLLFLLTTFMPQGVQAQHYEHATIWARTTITIPLSKNWDGQFEYLHRSQNNFRESRWNPFNHESFEEPRLWFYFKQPKFTIQLNPITYFYSEPLLGKEADFNIKPNHIWQAVIGLDLRQEQKKWTIKERVQYEYRWLKSLNFVPIGRLRFRGTVQYQATTKTKIQVFDEVFLNTPPHKLARNFDQNWFLVGIIHQLNKYVGLDLGIMRNYRQRQNRLEFDHETAINVGANFRIY
jgi:Protein of unknown function (DUF2490)